MKINIFILLITVSVFAASCQNQANKGKVINTTITADEFEKKLNENSNVQLIDVRTPDEYNKGHLKNALNYDINSSEFETQIANLDKNKPVLVYCLSGGRSASAAEIMSKNGIVEIYNMKGGVMIWSANNKPMDSGIAMPLTEGLTTLEFNKLINTDKYVLVDYNAKWCKPCIKMAPMLNEFVEKRKEKISLLKIDADENKKLLEENKIQSLPVLELYKNGKLIWKHEGEIDEATLINETKL